MLWNYKKRIPMKKINTTFFLNNDGKMEFLLETDKLQYIPNIGETVYIRRIDYIVISKSFNIDHNSMAIIVSKR